jgi:hypothetical protein
VIPWSCAAPVESSRRPPPLSMIEFLLTGVRPESWGGELIPVIRRFGGLAGNASGANGAPRRAPVPDPYGGKFFDPFRLLYSARVTSRKVSSAT